MRSSSEVLKHAIVATKEILQSLLDLDAHVENRAQFFGLDARICSSGEIRHFEELAKQGLAPSGTSGGRV
jgi:hypothetical protein